MSISNHEIQIGILVRIATLAITAALSFAASAHADKRFAYVASYSTETISGFEVDAVSGALTPMQGSPFATNIRGASTLAIDQVHGRLYAANDDSVYRGEKQNVTGYRIDPLTGRLIAVPGSPFMAGSGPASITVDPAGRFLYVANVGDANVSAFHINAASGTLTAVPGSPFPAGSSPQAAIIDPQGKFSMSPLTLQMTFTSTTLVSPQMG